MSPSDTSLELSDVKERFEASTLALDEVRRRLGSLAELQEKRVGAAEGLERASEELQRFTSAAIEAVDALRSAQTSATTAFESMRSVVDGTDLRQVAEGVVAIEGRLTEAQQKQAQALGGVERTVNEQLERLMGRVQAAEQTVLGLETSQKEGVAELHAKLDTLAGAIVQLENAAEERARAARRLHQELTTKLDSQATLQKEKGDLEKQLDLARRDLDELRQNFAKLSEVAGERAMRKAGLR